jgi:ligand-binding sensor domain-containing protein
MKPAQRGMCIIDNVTANKSVEDADGTIWAATDNGLYQVIDNKATPVPPGSGLPQSAPLVCWSQTITLCWWVPKAASGSASVKIFSRCTRNFTNEVVSTMMQDKRGDIWFGTINHGIFRLSPEGLEHLNIDNGIVHNRVQSILEDGNKVSGLAPTPG